MSCLSPAGYSTVLQDPVRTLRNAQHPSNCAAAIEGIFNSSATLSRTGSHVGSDWTAAPPAPVPRPEFPLAPEGHLRLVDRSSFPVTCITLIAAALVSDAPLSRPGRPAWIDHPHPHRSAGQAWRELVGYLALTASLRLSIPCDVVSFQTLASELAQTRHRRACSCPHTS